MTSPSSKVSVPVRNTIIRNYLYPRSLVPSQAVITILSLKYGPVNENNLAKSNDVQPFVNLSVHISLLKWLIIVYPYISDSQLITKLYSTLFTKIPYESTRPYVCHLLYLSTTQSIVVPWRCQLLIEFYLRSPNSAPIAGLLQAYKSYAPHVFSGVFSTVKIQRVFPHPDLDFELQIRKIHEQLSNNEEASLQLRQDLENEQEYNKSRKRNTSDHGDIDQDNDPRNRKRPNNFGNPNNPDIPTSIKSIPSPISSASILQTSLPTSYQPFLAIENVRTVRQFVSGYYKLAFPDRLGSVFGDTNGMLSRLLLYKGTSKEWDRLNSWLLQQLYDCVEWESETPDGYDADNNISLSNPRSNKTRNGSPSVIARVDNSAYLQFFLERLLTFYMYTRKLPEAAEEFIFEYLKAWDGVSHASIMRQLIPILPLRTSHSVETRILSPLRRIIDSNFASRHVYVYEILTMLVSNWQSAIVYEFQKEFGKNVPMQANYSDNQDNSQDSHTAWFLKHYSNRKELFHSLQVLCAFVDYYGLFSVEQFPEDVMIASSIVEFFKKVALLQSYIHDPYALTMSTDLYYRLFMFKSGVVLSKICDLARYWRYLTRLPTSKTPKSDEYEILSIILDICNSLWLNKAFTGAEERPSNWAKTYIKESLRVEKPLPAYFKLNPNLIASLRQMAKRNGLVLDRVFSLSWSPIFCLQTEQFWRSLEKEKEEEMGAEHGNGSFMLEKYLDVPPDKDSIARNAEAGGLDINAKTFKMMNLDKLGKNHYVGVQEILNSSLKLLIHRQSDSQS